MKKKHTIIATLLIFLAAISASFAAAGENGDDAVTAWAFVFNNPEDCIDNSTADLPPDQQLPGPCDSPVDLGPSGGAVIYLAGTRVQSNGRAILAGSISEDVGHAYVFGQLTSAAGAEIHIGLQTHGGLLGTQAERDLQTTTPGGGCNPSCGILQFIVFGPGAGLGTTQTSTASWASDDSPVDGSSGTLKRIDVEGDREIVVISIDTRL